MLQRFSNGTDLYALFHIGGGTGGNTKNCTASGERYPGETAGGSTLHTSTTGPGGPFLPANPLPSCNNPAPWLAANGTWMIVCDGFELYSAPYVNGPWTHVTTIRAAGGNPLPGNYEECVVQRLP